MNPLDIYSPKNELEYRLKENIEQDIRGTMRAYRDASSVSASASLSDASRVVSKALTVKYIGLANIGDRVVVNKTIEHPWKVIAEKAELETNLYLRDNPVAFPSFSEWARGNKCFILTSMMSLCCAPYWIHLGYSSWCLGIEEAARQKKISELTDVMLDEFYEEQVVNALKDADMKVNERIEELAHEQAKKTNVLFILSKQQQPRNINGEKDFPFSLTQNVQTIHPRPNYVG